MSSLIVEKVTRPKEEGGLLLQRHPAVGPSVSQNAVVIIRYSSLMTFAIGEDAIAITTCPPSASVFVQVSILPLSIFPSVVL